MPSPGVDFLTERLKVLLASPTTLAIIVGNPAVAVGLVTLRSNVWYLGAAAHAAGNRVALFKKCQCRGQAEAARNARDEDLCHGVRPCRLMFRQYEGELEHSFLIRLLSCLILRLSDVSAKLNACVCYTLT